MRKIEKRFVRSLCQSGHTYHLTLPIEIIRKFRWKKRQKLQLKVDLKKKKIIIQDWPQK